jgi:hypothetical protein
LEDDREVVTVAVGEFGMVKDADMTIKKLKSIVSHKLDYRVFRPLIL